MKGWYNILFFFVTFLVWMPKEIFGVEQKGVNVDLCYGDTYVCDTFFTSLHEKRHIELPMPLPSDSEVYVHPDGTIEFQILEDVYNEAGTIQYFLHFFWSPEPDISRLDTVLCAETAYSFTWNNRLILVEDSTYIDTVRNSTGCLLMDRELHVTVHTKHTDTLFLEAGTCSIDPYSYVWPDGYTQVISQGTIPKRQYERMIKYSGCDCDSVWGILTFRYITEVQFDYPAVLCTNKDEVYIPRFDRYLKGAGTYPAETIFYQQTGCIDTIYTITVSQQMPALSIIPTDTFPCYDPTGFDWRGGKHIIDEGTYRDTVRSTTCDCDSVIYVLNLKYHYRTDVVEDTFMCFGDTFKHYNKYVDSVGNGYYDYTNTYNYHEYWWKNVGGCDSTYTLNIHFSKPPVDSIATFTICAGDTFIEYGSKRPITETGIYYDTIFCRLGEGCDSIYWTYNVTRLDTTNSFEDFYICYADRPFMWHNKEYYHSATDKDTLLNSVGCDSFCYMNLYVTDAPYNELHDTIMCLGHPFMWGNKFVDETGTYIDTVKYPYYPSCDSVYRVIKVDTQDCCTHLTKLELVKPTFCADTKDYTMSLEYTAGMPHDYTVTFDYFGRQNGFHDASYEYAPFEATEYYAPIPITFDYAESQYLIPNGYECKVSVVDTCERSFTYNLTDTLKVYYPSWIAEQYLSNTLALLNEKYNGGYTFSSYQWYADEKPISGATQSYVSVYTQPSEKVAYSVYVVREEDGVGMFSCPIYLTDTHNEAAITESYVVVKPTVISVANPVIYITGNIGGSYILYDIVGRKLCSASFEMGNTSITVPVVTSQALFLRVVLNDGSQETFILLVQ